MIDNLGTSQQLEDILPLGLQLPPGSVLITTSRNAGLVMALMQTLPACRVLSQEVVGLVERVEKRELLCRCAVSSITSLVAASDVAQFLVCSFGLLGCS